jgi:ADP-heptose:LPS heptosyltransferase
MTSPPVVLVFRVGQLGDSIVSLPAIRAIRAAHPGARLVLLTDRQRGLTAVPSWEVFGPTGLFDDVAYLDVPSRLADYVAAARVVRAWAPARLYYLAPMPRTAWQAGRDRLFFRWLCRIPDVVGLRPTDRYPVRDGAGRLVRLAHESERLLEWIGQAPAPARAPDCLSVPADDQRRAARALDDAGFGGHPIVAIAPGSKMTSKLWPEERFGEVGCAVLRRFPDVRLVVLGSADERSLGDRLCSAWGSATVNLMGRLDVWEAAAILERCALYVGNDTGTMHLAAASGVTCVAIFSARDNPGRWEPSGEGHVVFRRDVPCAGCLLTECIVEDRACLKAIEASEVAAAVVARLETSIECLTSPSRASAG